MMACSLRVSHCAVASTLFLGLYLTRAEAQVKPPPPPGTPTAKVAAGARYDAGWFRRFFLGDNYRDLWTTPITVPVLDLATFADGLTPLEAKGGKQTKTLRLKGANGGVYVFRPVDKDGLDLPLGYENTIVEDVVRDQVSANHPTGALVSDVFLRAAGVLHPTPLLVVMPDDPRLGKFQADYAGRLGMIEPYPTVPDSPTYAVAGQISHHWTAGFAGAVQIINSDSLTALLDSLPGEQVDARAYLRARMIDMMLNDWDRHPGNWEWARMEPGGRWQPIPRDRDRVMIDYGAIPAMIGPFAPQMIRFQGEYPRMSGLTAKSVLLDRRLLSGLDVNAYDSIAVDLKARFTDALIDSALKALPREYHATIPEEAKKLRERRDQLPNHARDFYRYLAEVVNIHATDAADSATVTVVDKDHMDVEIRSGNGAPYFQRRFDRKDTHQLRLYLHDGDDRAEVRGDAEPAIPIRILGGNGNNQLVNVSEAGNDSDIDFYNEGEVTGIPYGPVPTFDRRPWVQKEMGDPVNPGRDWGSGFSPAASLDTEGDELGLIAALGVVRKSYGFGQHPYSNRVALVGEYAFGVSGYRVIGEADKRWEETAMHITARVQWSELELINFYGFGNDNTASGSEEYFRAPQKQWTVFPALEYALGPRSDLLLGPVFKHSSTHTGAGNYLADTSPYGIGEFSQAGLRVGLYKDSRIRGRDNYGGFMVDLSATVYPSALDVASRFGVLEANTAAYFTFPVVKRPFLSLKAGAKRVNGDFPFHEAAFIGGKPSERDIPRERYAGDGALYGSAELRIPVVGFAFILPIDIGAYVYGDAGRVYVDRLSPGGWHHSHGAGVWIGILNPASGVEVDLGNSVGRNIVQAKIGFEF